jgi:hypothetical protein
LVSDLWQDLRYAIRRFKTAGLRECRCPDVALGISANTAIFTLINAVMFNRCQCPPPNDWLRWAIPSARPRWGGRSDDRRPLISDTGGCAITTRCSRVCSRLAKPTTGDDG